MDPIPAILITGLSSAAKIRCSVALAAARPGGECWAILDNDTGELTQLAGAQLRVATVTGCMCCSGQVALQTGLVQLIRRSRPQRLIIVAAGAAEPAALQRALQQEHLVRAVQISHCLCVVAVEQMTTLPPAAHDLWLQQLLAADFVVAADDARAQSLNAKLTASGITGKRAVSSAEVLRAVLPPLVATAAAPRFARQVTQNHAKKMA
ncbi:MAG: GTP-binding protein [Burkholderiales bacterium]|nr:GTP-binding protein [Burkholderiales bacterium]